MSTRNTHIKLRDGQTNVNDDNNILTIFWLQFYIFFSAYFSRCIGRPKITRCIFLGLGLFMVSVFGSLYVKRKNGSFWPKPYFSFFLPISSNCFGAIQGWYERNQLISSIISNMIDITTNKPTKVIPIQKHHVKVG